MKKQIKIITLIFLSALLLSVLRIMGVQVGLFNKTSIYCSLPVNSRYKNIKEGLSDLFADFVFLSLVGLVTYFFVSKSRMDSESKIVFICPKCEHVENVLIKDKDKAICPKCYTKMVPLKGFYDKKTKEDIK